MNLLFYMQTVLVGGVRTVTEILSKGFRERGHNVKWLLLYRFYGDSRDFPKGEDCTYLLSKELLSPQNIDYYNDFVVSNKIDVVINQNALYGDVDLIDSLKVPGVTRISVIHSNPFLQKQWIWKDALTLRDSSLKEKLRLIARIVLYPRTKRNFENGLKKHYIKLLDGKSHINVLSPSYIEIVKSIIPDIDEISAIANPNTYADPLILPKENTILYVGRLDNRSKKINELLKIWGKVAECNPDWQLIIIGEGPDKDKLIKQANFLKRVNFLGYRNPRAYYERASILCMTSMFEGFPMVLTEAMQHGCVPIAYDSFPAIHDIIEDGVDGGIVKSFNREMYVEKLNSLIQNEAMRNTLSENAAINIRRYDSETIINQWEFLIKRLRHEK